MSAQTPNTKRLPELSDDLIWGAAPIATHIGRSLRQTYYLLERGQIPAKKIGGTWLASKRKLASLLMGEVV
jgi:hypothetical protein